MSTYRHILGFLFFVLYATAVLADPVEFRFEVPANPDEPNPFARELWADVTIPSKGVRAFPAFYDGNAFAVRVRTDATGTYILGRVSETTGSKPHDLIAHASIPTMIDVATPTTHPAVARDPVARRRFLASDGQPFVPVGANVAWPEGEVVPFYRSALAAFGGEHLNWMRVWMSHWGKLNLDWVRGATVPLGTIDAAVAGNWDAIVTEAEARGVYLQMVFQHHGQYTTGANSNWAENPWNAANPGGFLQRPTEFFSSAQARRLTKAKYRYIVARWGWSPAVFAWELFNEVHWVDAIDKEKNDALVGAWHSEMADWIRRVDVYGHLITTSADNLRSACYERMDFYQPHLYAADLITGVRRSGLPRDRAERPVFYGEIGDDHLDLTEVEKRAGGAIVPPMWAGLMGETAFPAQPWVGAEMIKNGRLHEAAQVRQFIATSGFLAQPDLRPFSSPVESEVRVPLVLRGCQVWQRREAPEFEMPVDGTLPLEAADVPRILVGSPGSFVDGFPDRAMYRINLPKATTLRAKVVGTGGGATALRFIVDGGTVAERIWSKDAADRPTNDKPVEIAFSVAAGRHVLRVENVGGADWVDLAGIDLGIDTSVLAAIGQRGERYIALWVWHRIGLQAAVPTAPATGVVTLANVPPGAWNVVWWSLRDGVPSPEPTRVQHAGGDLHLPTPPIDRQAVVVLTR